VNSSASFGFRLSSRRRNQGPQEEQKPIVPVEHPGEAERCRRGKILLVFWEQNRRERGAPFLRDVRYWPKADIVCRNAHVRFEG
jgi:hypothetical protein